jgi:xanthine/uracil permease
MLIKYKKWLLASAGILVGGIAGWAFWYYIGCESGTCPITSNPYRSMAYGAIMGLLLFWPERSE